MNKHKWITLSMVIAGIVTGWATYASVALYINMKNGYYNQNNHKATLQDAIHQEMSNIKKKNNNNNNQAYRIEPHEAIVLPDLGNRLNYQKLIPPIEQVNLLPGQQLFSPEVIHQALVLNCKNSTFYLFKKPDSNSNTLYIDSKAFLYRTYLSKKNPPLNKDYYPEYDAGNMFVNMSIENFSPVTGIIQHVQASTMDGRLIDMQSNAQHTQIIVNAISKYTAQYALFTNNTSTSKSFPLNTLDTVLIDINTKEVLAVSRRFIMGYGGDNSKLCDASNPNVASPIGINNLDDFDFLRWVYGNK
jgi:hypothetical protein